MPPMPQLNQRGRTNLTPENLMHVSHRRLKNESGIILVTVIILIMILSIVAIGVLSLNVSQLKTSSSVVDTIKAEQLATGLFYQDYQRRLDGTGTIPASPITIDGKAYTITRDADTAAGPNYNDTQRVRINITY